MDAAVAHDLKSPLASIEGYARLLLGGRGGELTVKQRSYVEGILAAARVLTHIIESLHLAEAIAREGVHTDESSGEAREILARVAGDFERAFAAKGARIEAQGHEIDLARGAELLERSVASLLLAALTTSQEKSEVRLTARRAGEDVVVSLEAPGVRGPGPGAGLDLIERIAAELGGRSDFRTGHFEVVFPGKAFRADE